MMTIVTTTPTKNPSFSPTILFSHFLVYIYILSPTSSFLFFFLSNKCKMYINQLSITWKSYFLINARKRTSTNQIKPVSWEKKKRNGAPPPKWWNTGFLCLLFMKRRTEQFEMMWKHHFALVLLEQQFSPFFDVVTWLNTFSCPQHSLWHFPKSHFIVNLSRFEHIHRLS